MDQRQGFARSSQALGDAPTEPGAVDRNNRIGPQALYRSDRLADPPQDQRRPRQHLCDADNREIGERHEAFDTLLAHPLTANSGNLEPITDAESQRSDQCRAKRITRGFAGNDKDKRRLVAAVLRPPSLARDTDDEQTGSVGCFDDLVAIKDNCCAGFDRNTAQTGFSGKCDGLRSDCGAVGALFLARLFQL